MRNRFIQSLKLLKRFLSEKLSFWWIEDANEFKGFWFTDVKITLDHFIMLQHQMRIKIFSYNRQIVSSCSKVHASCVKKIPKKVANVVKHIKTNAERNILNISLSKFISCSFYLTWIHMNAFLFSLMVELWYNIAETYIICFCHEVLD